MDDKKIDGFINESLMDVFNGLNKSLETLKDVMTIPVERLQSAMTQEGFASYCRIRTAMLEIFPLVELIVGSADSEVKCMCCGKPAEIVNVNGKQVLKGEVTHWVENGRIVHDYTCDKCIRKK